MSGLIKSIKGMPDILPSESQPWQHFETLTRQLMNLYGYEEIRLPIMEPTKLFKRSIGEVTDIVEKEMFTFLDRDQESISLRPEGTAGCVRACLEHGLLHNQEQRLWYAGPMFRYEKPQMGRFRQFYQVGVEAFNFIGPDIEVEHLLMMRRLWKWLGISPYIELQINSLGSKKTREHYREALVAYFSKYKQDLDEDSLRRLSSNPLRILDSKNPNLQEIIQQAPQCLDFLEPEDKAHFEELESLLRMNQIPYQLNPRLVRGLDYYNKTVYEWVTKSLGAQGTVCAGGRYDGLVETLGGRQTPATGFALGVERVLMVYQKHQTEDLKNADIYFISVGKKESEEAMHWMENIRDAFPHLNCLLHCGGGSFKNQFKRADKSGAKIALIMGENELTNQTVGIKFLREEREQQTLSKTDLFVFLTNYFKREGNVKSLKLGANV